MKSLILTSTLFCLSLLSFSQKEYETIAKRVLAADSIWIVNYAVYDSTEDARQLVKAKKFEMLFPKSINRLISEEKNEFVAIVKKTNHFSGRYASSRNFYPRQSVLLWTNGHYSYFEICLSSHDILASKDLGFEWLDIDPIKADELHDFFVELGIIKIPEIIK